MQRRVRHSSPDRFRTRRTCISSTELRLPYGPVRSGLSDAIGRRLLAGADPRSAVVPRGPGAPGAGEALAIRAEIEHEATVVAGGSARPSAGQDFAGDRP